MAIGGESILSFIFDYKHRSWNHVCFSLDGQSGILKFFFNGEIVGNSNLSKEIHIEGYPKNDKHFLIFGQEPDLFMGGFDQHQALQGKVSKFTWWSYVLSDLDVYALAKCEENGIPEGNVVSWNKNSFRVKSQFLEKLEPNEMCAFTDHWLFFQGRRTFEDADTLCAAHGGWVVVPRNAEENKKVLKMYKNNLDGCEQEGVDEIGWLGIKRYKDYYFISTPGKTTTANYTNFLR